LCLPVAVVEAVAEIDAGAQQRDHLAVGERRGNASVVRLDSVGHERPS
jgi:hypothetical protein